MLSFTKLRISNPPIKSLTAALLVAGAAMLQSAPAWAAGTAAGTDVDNTVTVNYNVGGVTQDPIVVLETFVVDNMIDLLVTGTDDIVAPAEDESTAILVFTVKNEGNDTQGYALDVNEISNTLGLTLSVDGTVGPGEYEIWIDSDGVGDPEQVYDPAGSDYAFDLAPDATSTVWIVAEIPSDAVDGESAELELLATTLNYDAAANINGTTVGVATLETGTPTIDAEDIIFADSAGTGDVAEDGMHSDIAEFTVASADLVVTKDAYVLYENAGLIDDGVCSTLATALTAETNLAAIPGSCIQYVITVENTGTVAATDVVISDPLPGTVTYQVLGSTPGLADASWTTAPNESGGTVSAEALTIPALSSVVIVIQALVL